jgi:threonine dehydrogenase-like Zn-dependent dehydrogenase
MRALCCYGKDDIRYDTVPGPMIEHPRDALIKVSLTP